MMKEEDSSSKKRKEEEDIGPPAKIRNANVLVDVEENSTGEIDDDQNDLNDVSDIEDNDMEDGEIISDPEDVMVNDGHNDVLQEQKQVSEETEKPEGLIQYRSKKVLKNACPKQLLKPLPPGWSEVKHECGLPIYFYGASKVVTWSRPYMLEGHLLKHNVPLTSIPCLHEQKYKEKLKGQPDDQNNKSKPDDEPSTSSSVNPHKVILHTTEETLIESDELNAYLDKCFEFSVVQVPHFEKWSQRRQHNKIMKQKKDESAFTEENQKDKATNRSLITLTVETTDENNGNGQNKKVVLTTSGKPMICILHEYAQRVLKAQPKYEFKETENSLEPFKAIVNLNGKDYGSATAINKKKAKNKAALETLEMLIPGFKNRLEDSKGYTPDSSYFGKISLTDPRVYELSVHAGQGTPYQLLTECLKRNQGITDTAIFYEVQQVRKKSLSYTIKCGKHEYQGMAKNKKMGKQLGAQQILKMLHPEVTLYKDLVDMYGFTIAQGRARKKQVDQEIFDLKQKRTLADSMQENNGTNSKNESLSFEPNPELLAKLHEMMQELHEANQKKQTKPKMTPMEAALATGKSFQVST